MENLIPTLYGWVVILCQLLALFAIVIGIAKGFVIYCQTRAFPCALWRTARMRQRPEGTLSR